MSGEITELTDRMREIFGNHQSFAGMDEDRRPFATVRGLDVDELRLPDSFGAREFTARVGDQIHLRILASKAMTDKDMVDFLATSKRGIIR